jgi:hypothetical protein
MERTRSSCCLYVKKRSDGSEDISLANGWMIFLPRKYAGLIQLDDVVDQVGSMGDFPENLLVNGLPIAKLKRLTVVRAA